MNRTVRLRVAVSRADTKDLRATINALNRQDLGGLHPAERSALRALRSSRDPARSILQPHYGPALQPVAEVMTHDCLEATRGALGEAADEPSREQLRQALAEVRSRFSAATVALLLAVTATSDAPAADICHQILDEDEEFGLQEVEEGGPGAEQDSGPPPPAPARRRRPAKGKARKAPQAADHKAWKAARATATEYSDPALTPADQASVSVAVSRRAASLPPRYAASYDSDDPLCGAVIIAEVAFTSDDPRDHPTGSKVRPCVVVAGGLRTLLVRAAYTGRFHAESWRSTELAHWRRAGLTKPTHIEADFKEVGRAGVEVVGRLTDEDWNSLW